MLTNLQFYLAIGLPVFAILTSLIVSLVQISAIRTDMRDLRVDVKSELKEARAESKAELKDARAEFIAELKEARAESIAELKEMKASIDLLTGKVYEMMGHRP